ncbi:GNAT family N-acetyltransferase [Streptomyces sp. NPDC090077]|uniref:GNAT family N-acetyltransferase n=1 Tax=Streptomyces sp. NPDC090077 TaxID=3365938 RepID=UPI00380341C9
MQSITIRRAVAQDAERLTSLVQQSAAYRGQYASMVSGYEVTPAYVARHRVFAAVDASDLPVGFYSLVVEPPELDLAFVSDEAQGLGVGRLLIGHMLDQAADAGLAGVRVVSHPPAERFYRRLGAQRVGTVPPMPPEAGWERPELWFTVPARAPRATTAP